MMTSTQKARVYRQFVNGAIVMSLELHEDVDRMFAPSECHGVVEKSVQLRLTHVALKLGLTEEEWDREMTYAIAWEQKRCGYEVPMAYEAYSYGVTPVYLADRIRTDPYRQLKTRLALYKREKLARYGEDALGVSIPDLLIRRTGATPIPQPA